MRYYSIKISGASSSQTPTSASGGIGSDFVAAPPPTAINSSTPSLRSLDRGWRSAPAIVPRAVSSGGIGSDFVAAPPPADSSASGVPNSIQSVNGASISGSQWTSEINGVNDPGALDIVFDIQLTLGATDSPYSGSAHITVYGIPISVISQQSNFNDCQLQLYAGFGHGLPLAELQYPHRGKILDGKIWPCFGNWVLNNTSIEFVVTPGKLDQGGPTDPKNVIHNMPAGMQLSTAIQNALTIAYPGAQLNIAISPKLKLTYPDWGFHQSITQYAAYVKALSHSILGTPSTSGYQGVKISMQGNTIKVTDGTTKGGAVNIIYEDLVGQPTWIGNQAIQVMTLLRADIGPTTDNAGNPQIILPPTLTTTTEQLGTIPQPGLNGNYLTFQGTWDVQKVRHIGHFRDPQWNSWLTIIEAIQSGGGGGSGTSTPTNTGGKQTWTGSGSGPPGAEGGLGPGGVTP
jgi:hypothetical protein